MWLIVVVFVHALSRAMDLRPFWSLDMYYGLGVCGVVLLRIVWGVPHYAGSKRRDRKVPTGTF